MQYHRFAGAAALAFAVIVSGCGGHQQARGPMALDVDVSHAQRQSIATYLTLDGQIAPLQDSTLSFQQSGPLATIYVNQGDRVTAGELLAKIDDSTLRAQLAQVQAQIAQSNAQAQSSALNVPITQANTSQAVSSAKAALANAKLAYDQDSHSSNRATSRSRSSCKLGRPMSQRNRNIKARLQTKGIPACKVRRRKPRVKRSGQPRRKPTCCARRSAKPRCIRRSTAS